MQMGCLCVRVIEEVKGSVIRVKGCRDRAGVVHNIKGIPVWVIEEALGCHKGATGGGGGARLRVCVYR